MEQDIERLLEKYYDGETTLEEERELKSFFAEGEVPQHLNSHVAQFQFFTETKKEMPSLAFRQALEMRLDPPKPGPARRLGSWLLRIAAGLALLLTGFAGGWFLTHPEKQVAATGEEAEAVNLLRVLAFEKVDKTSASERIQAVNQVYKLNEAGQNITQTLINTLNFDPNVNVRLAACQALVHFQDEPGVSEALIQSLTIQSDPNVQISLIEALVAVKEKRATDQFRQLIEDKRVLEAVRTRAESGLGQLNAADV